MINERESISGVAREAAWESIPRLRAPLRVPAAPHN